MDELVDVVDSNDAPTGKKKEKILVHRDGDWHRVSHVWIVIPGGYLLCQKRSNIKIHYSGVWDVIHGGHVKTGSNYLETAIEELKEEIGLDVNSKDLIDIGLYKVDNSEGKYKFRDICQAFMLIYKGKLDDLKIDNDEVSELKIFDIDELSELVHNPKTKNMFLPGIVQMPYFDVAIKRIKEIIGIPQ